MRNLMIATASFLAFASSAGATEYKIDPDHTFPSFVADHMGLDHWRGKFNATSGTITLDQRKGEGTVELTIDPASIDASSERMSPNVFSVTITSNSVGRRRSCIEQLST